MEVKTELGCSTTDNQRWSFSQEVSATGYAKYLERLPEVERWFVFLIPGGWLHEKKLRDHIAQSDQAGSIRFKVVTWENIYCEIEAGSKTRDPIIGEFQLLLSKRFEPIRFNKSEVYMLQDPDVLRAVWKLSKLIRLISEKAKGAGYKVKMEVDYKGGSYGFYMGKDNKYLLYFGCWVAFAEKVHHPLCIGVEDSSGDDVRRRFIESSPAEPISFADHHGSWTMRWVDEEDMSTNDSAGTIWESIQPMVVGVFAF